MKRMESRGRDDLVPSESFENFYRRLRSKIVVSGEKVSNVLFTIIEERVDERYREYLKKRYNEGDKADAILLKISCSRGCHLLTKERRLCEALEEICKGKKVNCMPFDDYDVHNLHERLSLIVEDP